MLVKQFSFLSIFFTNILNILQTQEAIIGQIKPQKMMEGEGSHLFFLSRLQVLIVTTTRTAELCVVIV